MKSQNNDATNGLSLISIKSNTIVENNKNLNNAELTDIIIKSIEEGFIVAYLYNKVIIGKIYNNRLIFYNDDEIDIKYLVMLRAFNKNEELYIWRNSGNRFNYRLRKDGEGEEKNAVDAEQILWGTKSENLTEGWTRLSESRGMELIVPIDMDKSKDKKRIKLRTRHYIGFNELGQAGYIDSRFVDIL